MNRTTIKAIISLMAFCTGSVIISAYTDGQPSQQIRSENIPDYVVYDQLFRTVKAFDREAENLIAQGQNGKIWSEYFEQSGKLNKEQSAVLKQVANDFINEVYPVDARAKQIIDEVRANYPNGQIPAGQELPAAPAELFTLQQQRNEIVLRHRNNLNNLLGTKSFDKFDLFVQQKIANNMRPFEPENTALKTWSEQNANQP